MAYTVEFKKLVANNPKMLRNVLEVLPALERQGEHSSVNQDGLRITFFQARNWSNNFKVETGDEAFFVRKELGRGTGFNAIKAFQEAKRRLGDDPNVGFINYQLGYTDKFGNDYFVAKWENFPILSDYLGQETLPDDERDAIAEKLSLIYTVLSDFKDVTTANMFYDPERKKILLFDLEMKKRDESETS